MLIDRKQEIGVFFFQAEDGIRDKLVTGVQTCALPISTRLTFSSFAATRTLSVPSMLILFVSMGSFTERGTDVFAARCSTYSASCMAFRTTSMSVMLPLMK